MRQRRGALQKRPVNVCYVIKVSKLGRCLHFSGCCFFQHFLRFFFFIFPFGELDTKYIYKSF